MRKILRRLLLCLLAASAVWFGALIKDREKLSQQLVRLHVVANSDSQADQTVKLQVRDAVIESLRRDLEQVADVETAKAYLQENLPKIQSVANKALKAAGVEQEAVVTLCKEVFDVRHYDTFSLPSGVYESLRITIGEGEGHNWWCVAFPSLCVPATAEGFADVAVGAGFSDTLTETLTGSAEYEVRFYFLDLLGKAENYFFRSQ